MASTPASEVPAGWQPIETAPKDGTDIMLSNGDVVTEGHWMHDEGGTIEHRDSDGRYIGQDDREGFDGWIDWHGGMLPEPTHWMPLPAAPGAATPASSASEVPADEVIEFAEALEQQRAYKIVADVAALNVGKPAEIPTPFQAGYQLACEEIEHRLRTEQWELAEGVYAPIASERATPASPATEGEAASESLWQTVRDVLGNFTLTYWCGDDDERLFLTDHLCQKGATDTSTGSSELDILCDDVVAAIEHRAAHPSATGLAAPIEAEAQKAVANKGQRGPADADFPWPKLLKPAHVCGATFGVGVSSRLVVECAQRHAAYKAEEAAKTPEERQRDEVNRRSLWDMINGVPDPSNPLADVLAEQAGRTVYSGRPKGVPTSSASTEAVAELSEDEAVTLAGRFIDAPATPAYGFTKESFRRFLRALAKKNGWRLGGADHG